MGGKAQEIRELVAGILGVPAAELSDSTEVGSLPQWDSLAQVAIVTTLEDDYGVDFDLSSEAGTLGELIALAEGRTPGEVGQQAAPATPVAHASPPPTAVAQAEPLSSPVVEAVLRKAEELPAKTAIVFENHSITYRQLAEGIYAAAHRMAAAGVEPGGTVALAARKHKEFVYHYFGAHLLGASVLNLDPDINDERLAYIYSRVQPALCVGIRGERSVEYTALAGDASAMPSRARMEGVADIMFTTGTSGEPKGVPLTHANLAAAASQINTFIGTAQEDVELLALPIQHSFGMGRMRCVLAVGGTVIMHNGYTNVKHLMAQMSNYRATGFAMVPAAWACLDRMAGDKIGAAGASLRYIELGSAPLPPESRARLCSLFPQAHICYHYGLTEASRSAFVDLHAQADHPEVSGTAAPGVEIGIFSPDGERLPVGGAGEICIRGAHAMAAYLGGEPEDCHYGAFFRTGDWGHMGPDGQLHYGGRIKDIINTGGKKVSPEEVEGVLLSLPGVADCACVAAPDPQGLMGEVIKAILVSDGSPRPDDKAVKDAVAARLESYKVPALIEWRDELKRTASGKLQRQYMH